MQSFSYIGNMLWKHLIGFIFCTLMSISLFGQNFIVEYPHFAGLNTGNSHAVEDLGMSAIGSPALSIFSGTQQWSLSYRTMTFGDFGLQHMQAGGKFKFRENQHFGLQARYTGNSAVHVLHFAGQYGRQLFNNFSAGIQINYGQRTAPQYEIENQLSLDLALYSEPLDRLELGLWLQHIFPVIGSSFENAAILCSAKYSLSEVFALYGSFYQDINSELLVGTGIMYRVSKQWDFKVAYFPNTAAFTLGLGFRMDHWGGHTGSYIQPQFGWQPGAALYYHN